MIVVSWSPRSTPPPSDANSPWSHQEEHITTTSIIATIITYVEMLQLHFDIIHSVLQNEYTYYA